MKKNTKIIIASSIMILIIAISAGIYAYFTYRVSAENTIILGYNKIALNENYEPPLTMEKGIRFKKEPYVTNTGNVDCYVRVKSVVSDSRVEQDLTIDYNNENFDYNSEDGYWYYKTALKPGEFTEKLFTTVSIEQDADDYVLDGFDIYVYAESVQTVEGKSMEEVWNYFSN